MNSNNSVSVINEGVEHVDNTAVTAVKETQSSKQGPEKGTEKQVGAAPGPVGGVDPKKLRKQQKRKRYLERKKAAAAAAATAQETEHVGDRAPFNPPPVVSRPAAGKPNVTPAVPRAAQAPPMPPTVRAVTPPAAPKRTVVENLHAFKARLPAGHPGLTALRALNVPTEEAPDQDLGSHPASAQVRRYVLVQAYAKLYSMGFRKILAIKGTARDISVVNWLNRDVPDKDKLVLSVYFAVTSAKDIGREMPGSVTELGSPGSYDAYVMCDQYSWLGTPLTPELLHAIVGDAPLVWIGHQFDGAFGTICGEGGWMRVWPAGKTSDYIMHRSDLTEAARALHDPLDWIKVENSKQLPDGSALGWTQVTHVGSMVAMILRRTRGEIEQALVAPPEERFAWVELPLPDDSFATSWLLYAAQYLPVLWALPRKRALVDRHLERSLIQQLNGRQYTAYSFRAISNSAASKAEADPELKLLARLFPSTLPIVVESTVVSAYLTAVKRRSLTAGFINVGHAKDMSRYNAETAIIGAEPTPRWWQTWKGRGLLLVMLAGAAVLLRKRLNIATLGSVVQTTAEDTPRATKWWHPSQIVETAQAVVDGASRAVVRTVTYIPRQMKRRAYELYLCFGYGIKTQTMTITVQDAVKTAAIRILLEEVCKMNPVTGLLFIAYEAGIKLLAVDWTNPAAVAGVPLGTGAAVAMHLLSMGLPFPVRYAVHWAWNSLVWTTLGHTVMSIVKNGPLGGGWNEAIDAATGMLRYDSFRGYRSQLVQVDEGVTNGWLAFRSHFYDAPWEARGDWPEALWPMRCPFAPIEGRVQKESRPYFLEKERDPSLKVKGECLLDPEERASTHVWFILPTNIPVYSPGRTDANLLGVLAGRLLILPPMDPEAQRLSWKPLTALAQQTIAQVHLPLVWEEEIDAYLAHVTEPFKRARALRALAEYKRDGLPDDYRGLLTNDVFVKTDEVLLKRSDRGVEMKPRAIINVDPRVQVEVGPLIWRAAERLHDEWAWSWLDRMPMVMEMVTGHRVEIRFTFGSDATDRKLSEWADEVVHWHPDFGAWILVAGDDSVVVVYQNGEITAILEGDFSMYDQSQSWGPLKTELAILSRLGVPKHATGRLLQCTRSRYVAKARGGKVTVDHPDRPMRVTGGADTTIGNSTVTGIAWLFALTQLTWGLPAREQGTIVDLAMAQLGFEIKLKWQAQLTDTSFLKGSWVIANGHLHWAPLPSRILKIGKTLRNPQEMYRDLDERSAGEQYLNDVAASYRFFVQVPGIAGFVRAFYRRPARLDLRVVKPWTVQSDYTQVMRPDSVEGLENRYDLDAETLWGMDRCIADARAYEFLSHPAFAKLAQVDYN